jgi:type IV pilus assembly protein PilX
MARTSRTPLKLSRHQGGAALVVGLMILLVLTLIGIAGVQTTQLEERMSGNLRDQNEAFQAAEAALRDAEDYIEGLVNTSGFTGKGLYAQNTAPNPFSADVWQTSGNKSIAYRGSLGDLDASNAPRFFIELKGQIVADKNTQINMMNYGETTGGGAITVFRVVASSAGRSGTSRVVVEEYYGRRL